MTLRSLPTATRSLVLDMTVPGNPIPWRRVRRGAQGQSYVPSDVLAAESNLGFLARATKQTVYLLWPLTEPMEIDVTFYRSTKHRADIDNLLKLVFDSFNEVVWKDDSQVVEVHARKRIDKENPRTEVQVWKLVEA